MRTNGFYEFKISHNFYARQAENGEATLEQHFMHLLVHHLY